MKILFLYAEVTGYLLGCLRVLRAHPQVSEIRVYQNLRLPENDYRIGADSPVPVRNAIGRPADELWPEIAAFGPDLVFVSGWMFRKYYQLAKRLRAAGAVLVIGNDTPWYGTARQWAGAASSPFWLAPLYDYMWVPGASQYAFARRLGFAPHRIQTGLLSADVDAFRQARKPQDKPVKTLLSVGSFSPNKGMARLQSAFSQLVEGGLSGWELHLVGSAAGGEQLPPAPGVRITPFVQPEALPQIFAGADAFALASLKESWGVVVHEAACTGLPLLLSENVGAAADFLEAGRNGLLFDPRSPEDLLKKMQHMLSFPEAKRQEMGAHSEMLSHRYSPEIWVEKLLGMARREPICKP